MPCKCFFLHGLLTLSTTILFNFRDTAQQYQLLFPTLVIGTLSFHSCSPYLTHTSCTTTTTLTHFPSPHDHSVQTQYQETHSKSHTSHHKSSNSTTEPSSFSQALKDPNWRKAMSEEYDALVHNGTWELVPPNGITNLIGCMWLYRIKINFDCSINRFKTRLIAKGFHQHPGVDYYETFSPVVNHYSSFGT